MPVFFKTYHLTLAVIAWLGLYLFTGGYIHPQETGKIQIKAKKSESDAAVKEDDASSKKPLKLKAENSIVYRLEIATRLGFHFVKDSAMWADSRRMSIEKDLLLTKNSNYYAGGIDASSTYSTMYPFFQIEAIWGIYWERLPGIQDLIIENRNPFTFYKPKFAGFRMGAGISIYPFTRRNSFSYNGPIVFNNPDSYDASLTTMPYNGSITVDETLLVVAPTLGLYYYHEPGVILKNKLIPYGGLELGPSIISGKRKYILKTEPLSAGGGSYEIDAAVQEEFMNRIAFRITPVAGVQYHVSGPHFIELRLGYIIQKTRAPLTRRGAFTEKKTDSGGNTLFTYSQQVYTENTTSELSHNGFFVSLGYTIGLK